MSKIITLGNENREEPRQPGERRVGDKITYLDSKKRQCSGTIVGIQVSQDRSHARFKILPLFGIRATWSEPIKLNK